MTRDQRIAREWLIFLCCVIVGLLVTYVAIYANRPVYNYGDHNNLHEIIKYKNPGDMFNDLLAPRRSFALWALTLAPYVMISLARSIFWAIKTLRISGKA